MDVQLQIEGFIPSTQNCSIRTPTAWPIAPTAPSPQLAHPIGDGACIVFHGEDRQRQLGLGVPRAVSMMVMTLLEESVVSGL